MRPNNIWALMALAALCSLGLTACSQRPKESPEQRRDSAKALFEQTTKSYHTPSAEATGAEKARLQEQAVAGYELLLKKYSDQEYWAAQGLRNLAGIRAAQGKLRDAIALFASVERKYPKQEWEVLMAWKTAADLLWENGERDAARSYYQKVVNAFDKPESPQVVKTVVRGSKLRLAGQSLPGETTGK